ncbi:MAG: hypothetical protein WC619_04000 [Patescibacteria group bacterium]
MFKNKLVKKIANLLSLKELGKRALTVIILTLTAIITVWVYAAFTEPLAGPNDSDQDFLQNILGANNADNDFTSTSVVSDADGSVIERQEYIQTGIGTNTSATTTPSAAFSLWGGLKYIEGNMVKDAHDCSDSDAVGTICSGGMKFAIGLVAMPSGCITTNINPVCNGVTDSVTKTWSAVAGSDEPADSTTDGWSNTGKLVYDVLQTNAAAQYCYEMVYQGYDDWYLPAKDELNTLYGQKTAVGGFFDNVYWSSTGGPY